MDNVVLEAANDFDPHCRLCDKSLAGRPASYAIERAPPGVNELPMSGVGQRTTVRLNLLECPWCGHFQLPDPPVATWREAVTAAGLSEEMRTFRREQFVGFVAGHELRNRAVLDIGCGEGAFFDLLEDAGLQPRGLEAGSARVDAGTAKGRRIRRGHAQEDGLAGERIDAFICINFLEHATRPVDLLRNVRQACDSGAVGLVEVPNFERDLQLGRSHDLVREHLSYFTRHSLRLTLELSGFNVVSMRSVWHDDDLEAVVIPRIPVRLHDWDLRNPALRLVREFCGEPSHRPVAIWGASHQALTLLGMLGDCGVVAIADISPAKQGRVDPVWGIPIVKPEDMLARRPAAVLILAAGYWREVAEQMRSLGYAGTAAALVGSELVMV